MTVGLIDLILKQEIQEFIRSHEQDDVHKLLLKKKTVLGVPTKQIAQQIIGIRKAQSKLPLWYNAEGIIYPPAINLEQSSSEATAQFKLRLLEGLFQTSPVIADLTGGFGIDTYFLSQYAKEVHYVEPDQNLLEITKHNHYALGATNITYHNQSAESFLASSKENPAFLYFDPSRRKGTKKVFKLANCEPNVTELQSKYFIGVNHILIKASPLLDLQQGSKELADVKTIFVVAVENECRELLFYIQPGFRGEPTIRAVDLNRNGKILNDCNFSFGEEKKSIATFSQPLSYLYEPNTAILKGGAFKWVAQKYEISKLAPNTHLYTSDKSIDNFPGRIFKTLHLAKPDKNLIKLFPEGYANILTRNYPLSVEEIKKKTGLKEGGEQYLICTQTEKEKIVLIADRLK